MFLFELNDLIESDQVALTAKGTGGSSGMVVNGYVRYSMPREFFISALINRGIYLKNSGAGQNMIAIQIYYKGGQYFSDGSRKFIAVQPQENAEIRFIAFCADLERDNPSLEESFAIDTMPAELQTITANITRYLEENPSNENRNTVAQIALWRSQGKTWSEIKEIRRYFRFTQSDWDSSSILLNY
jgi:hypothetical protein